MGYNSEVALVVDKQAYSRLMAKAAKSVEATRELVEAIEDDNHRGNGSVLFWFRWGKWYSDYPIVQAIEEFMEEEDGRYDDFEAYQFIRIGESSDDAVERGSYEHGLCLERSISF